MPALKKIDLSKGGDSSHPDINTESEYLVKIDNKWFAGRFVKIWFGLSFQEWFGQPFQYDKPETNRSRWEEIWEIQE